MPLMASLTQNEGSRMKTTLVQDCTIYEDDSGTIQYRIESAISDLLLGDLPYPEIFLFQVGVPSDPKSDTFLRIAVLTDLTGQPRGRSTALARGETTYLAASFRIEYDDLSTAVQGKGVIQARIDDLISNWRLYSGEFAAPTAFDLPLASVSAVTAAKEKLRAAITARDSKNTDLSQASSVFATKQDAATRAAGALALASSLATTSANLSSEVQALYTADSNYRGATSGFLSAAGVFSALAHGPADNGGTGSPLAQGLTEFDLAITAMTNAAIADAQGAQPMLDALARELSTNSAALASQLSSARAAKQAADAAVASARTKVSLAEAALADAQADADSALVTVKNYCPSFDPATDL